MSRNLGFENMNLEDRDLEDINYQFGGLNAVTDTEQMMICEALLKLTKKQRDEVTEKVWFVSEMKTNAQTIQLKDIPKTKKAIIFLSRDIQKMKLDVAVFTILHEIGHFFLKHPHMSFLKSESRSENYQDACEDQADKFANICLR